jgi:hypothetical protein
MVLSFRAVAEEESPEKVIFRSTTRTLAHHYEVDQRENC